MFLYITALIIWVLFDLISSGLVEQDEKWLAFFMRFVGLFMAVIIITTEIKYGLL